MLKKMYYNQKKHIMQKSFNNLYLFNLINNYYLGYYFFCIINYLLLTNELHVMSSKEYVVQTKYVGTFYTILIDCLNFYSPHYRYLCGL